MKKRLGDVISVAPWSSLDLSNYYSWRKEDKIGEEGARMLSEVMKNNSTITSLNLGSV